MDVDEDPDTGVKPPLPWRRHLLAPLVFIGCTAFGVWLGGHIAFRWGPN